MSESSRIGKVLPNLKVTVGGGNSSLEEGECYETEEEESVLPSTVLKKNETILKWESTSNMVKVQSNKYEGFETGLDLSSEHLIKKLEKRAARFGLKKEEQCQITSDEINALYKSLGMDPENLESSCKNFRLRVIHMRGVKDMSTEDVIVYFRDYGPSAVEWINDLSCNVCWNDNVSAARALLGVSQPIVIKRKSKKGSQIKRSSEIGESSNETKSATEVLKGKSEKIFKHKTEKCTLTELEINNMDYFQVTEPQSNSPMELDEESCNSASEDDLKNLELELPIPPGCWRLGVSHPKASTLLLRFATKEDKKLPGAEKRSQYYQKYGNPNYGGLRGLISNSRKRKYQVMQTRQVVESLSSYKDDPNYTTDIKRIRQRLNIPVDRMRMYADIEEDKRTRRSAPGGCIKPQSIKSRLGKRYIRDDLYKIGSQFSYEEDAPVEELRVECKIPSRFSIWNEQAKLMAQENDEESDDDDVEEGLDEEEEKEGFNEEEEEDYQPNRRYCAYGSERSSYESQKQYGYLNHSKDLRIALNSSKGRDLRSRIGNLKSDVKHQKHRSPLLRDDF